MKYIPTIKAPFGRASTGSGSIPVA
jgi:hypothetical protein